MEQPYFIELSSWPNKRDEKMKTIMYMYYIHEFEHNLFIVSIMAHSLGVHVTIHCDVNN